MIKVLIVLSMFWWAGCTQQEESKRADLIQRVKTGVLEDGGIIEVHYSEPRFDPTKHYIISIDTVGWAKEESYYLDTTWWARKDCCDDDSVRGFFADPVDIMVWQPTLDTTWADKEHLLVTPEEAEKLRKLIQ